MELITGQGKTTELINRAHKTQKIIVVRSPTEADRVWQEAQHLDKEIPYPMTYQDILGGRFRGREIDAFLYDDIDDFLRFISMGEDVEAGTCTPTEVTELELDT